MFDRLISLIGEEKFSLIKTKKILVLGCGGVGGYVVEGLVRSGTQQITVVDKDIIDETNLNRQIIALHSTIGKKKVDIIKERMSDINPNINITALDLTLTEENVCELKLEEYDYIVDAVDDVKVKLALIKYCLKNDIKLVCSTGTAKKMHPEYLKMITLDKTQNDPLARKLRTNLKGYNLKKIIALSSDEVPIKTEDNILGSTAFVPSSAGLLIASYIINDIIK